MGKIAAGMATVQPYVASVNSPPQYIVLYPQSLRYTTVSIVGSCHHQPCRGGATAAHLWQRFLQQRGPSVLIGPAHCNVDILENVFRRDAAGPIGRFDQVVACDAPVLAAEYIDESERFGQLPGPNQKSGAINVPFGRSFPHVVQP
jgi:hypothetical protein